MFRPFTFSHNSNYDEGCRNHNWIWECKYHNCYLVKIYLLKAFPHHHFHESKRNLMTLRFYGVCVPIHVNLSNHNQKTRLVTNPNSYGLNLCSHNFLPFLIIRTMKRDVVIIIEFENTINTTVISLNLLSESVSSPSFSWIGEKPYGTDLIAYVFLSMWIVKTIVTRQG